MAFSCVSVLPKDMYMWQSFDDIKQLGDNCLFDLKQINETIGIVKINSDLYLGICAEDVRNSFIQRTPMNMFDRVACLSMLDKEYCPKQDPFPYLLIGEVPQQNLKTDFPEITVDHNSEYLGDVDDSCLDFERQLPKLLEMLDSYIVEGKRVLILINCFAGIYRSPAMGMGFLMSTMNISAEESLRKIRNVRSVVDPRERFINVLKNHFAAK